MPFKIKIYFKGDDGGGAITALSLDMSDAGKATFNGVVMLMQVSLLITLTIDGTEIDLSSGDLTLDVAGDIILDAAGEQVRFHDGSALIGMVNMDS